MREAGSALMGIGVARGDNRAVEAARAAISSPLLETTLDGATGILLNITGGPDLGLAEVDEAAQVVTNAADSNANVIFGAVIDEAMGEDVRVTAIATGFGARPRRRRAEAPVGSQPSPSARRSTHRASRRRARHSLVSPRGLSRSRVDPEVPANRRREAAAFRGRVVADLRPSRSRLFGRC
jgi:cell division GTPase FtsZ